MESTKSQKRIDTMVKRAPVFLLISLILLLASIWVGSFSLIYMLSSIMFGLIYTVLTLIGWKLESYPLLPWILYIPAIYLLIRGSHLAEKWAFPEMHHVNWWLNVQYPSAVFTVFFLTLFVLRSFIRNYVSGSAPNPASAL